MAVVTAFSVLNYTQLAGLTGYFRATGCTAVTIADVLPILSKITVYEEEYIIGQMRIWDTSTGESAEPNNCAMVHVMIYNDGWVCSWFEKETQNQETSPLCGFVDAQTLDNLGSVSTEYLDKYNGCLLKVTSSSPTDSECPDDTVFCIRETDFINGRIKVHEDTSTNGYHFNTGHTYATEVYMTNGNLVWWGHTSNTHASPTNLSNRLYRAIYEMWEELRYSSNATDATDTTATKAFLDDGGVFTDYTTEFNNATVNDCPLMPATEDVDDAFYYGSSNKFNGLNLNIGTAGVGNTIVWEYWDGSAWSSLTVTDNTVGFTVLGENTVTFTPYDSWAKCFVNSSEQYWIRSRVSVAAFTTQPLLTQGWVIVPDSLLYSNSNLGMYSFEDTSALYCLICGVGTYAQNSNDDTYFYNTALLSKTIYSHSISCGGYIKSVYTTGSIYFNSVLYLNVKDLSGYKTNGYHIFNIEDIDHPAGVQNSFRCYAYSSESNYRSYMTLAVVLITS